MAVATEYTIKMACGHTEAKDLSDKPAHNRKSFANWLSKKGKCRECYLKDNRNDFEKRRLEIARNNIGLYELPDLEGTEGQTKYGTIVRDRLITQALEDLIRGEDATMDDETFEEQILVPARHFSHGGWWMDNKDSTTEDLVEILESFLEDPLSA